MAVAAALIFAPPSPSHAAPLPAGITSELRVAPPTPLPVRGPRYAPLTVDVYLSIPISPLASEAAPLCDKLLSRGDVRIIYHLAGTSTAPSLATVEALLEAEREERFFPLLDALLARARDGRTVGSDELGRISVAAGLSAEEVRAALDDHRHRDRALSLIAQTRAAGRGANQILINGAPTPMRLTDRDLAQTIATQRRRAQLLLDEGVPLTRIYDRLTRDEGGYNYDPSAPGERRRVAIDLTGAPARGPDVAAVTIVLFSSFACIACTRVHGMLERINLRFPGQIRLVWKNLPTSPSSELAAEFAVAAQAQHGFWAFYDLALPRDPAPHRPALWTYSLDRATLSAHATAAGLDGARIEAELLRGVHRAEVQRDLAEALRLGIVSPGTTVLNGVVLPSSLSYDQYEGAVQRELERGLLSRFRGDN